MSAWTALTFELPVALEDEILQALHEAGTIGLQIQEPFGQPPSAVQRGARGGASAAREAGAESGSRGGRPGPVRGGAARALKGAPSGAARARAEARDGPSAAAKMEAPASRRTAIAFFEHGADIAAVVEKLQALGPRVVLGTHLVEEEPWVERQDQGRGPLRIGRRFLVLPRASTGSIDGSPALDPHPDPVDLLPASHARGAADRRHRHDAPGVRAGTHAAQGHRAEGAAGGARAADERIVLVVPARRAFGTGEHATTRGCLELLEDVPVEGRAVLDLGTGSGILAMAAARLGAGTVVGLDEDPEAIAIARDNLALNGLEGFPDAPPAAAARAAAVPGDPGPSETRARDRSRLGGVQLLVGQLACIEGRFDLILANIDAAVLESLAEPLARLQAAGGDVILSGFSPADATVLTGVFGGFGYREIRRFEEGEWAALRLGRSGGMAPRAAREGM